MLLSARRGISYPDPARTDRPDIPAHIVNLVNALEADMVVAQGTNATRLARAHMLGVFFYETDTGLSYYDDGAVWHNLTPPVSPRTLALQPPINLTGTVLETDLINVTIPGGSLGLNGQLVWDADVIAVRPSTLGEVIATVRCYWGGTVISTWRQSLGAANVTNLYPSVNGANNGDGQGNAILILRNNNSLANQTAFWRSGLPMFSANQINYNVVGLTKDTSVDTVFRITAQLSFSDNTRQLFVYDQKLVLY